jgi:pyrroline-5-carboxylate reductase
MKIELPNSWAGVTVKQFQALQKILAEKGDEYPTNVAIISIMSGVRVDEIETYSLKTYAKCMNTLSFLTEQLVGQVQKVVEFGGVRYDVITDVYNLGRRSVHHA